MKPKIITLPDGGKIKYRVSKKTQDWTLLEVVIKNPKILELLDHFSTSVNEVTENKKESEKDVEKEPKKEIKKDDKYTEKQINEMKDIKSKMNISENGELNEFVIEWSYGQGKTYKYLNINNINDFINFMKKQYLTK